MSWADQADTDSDDEDDLPKSRTKTKSKMSLLSSLPAPTSKTSSKRSNNNSSTSSNKGKPKNQHSNSQTTPKVLRSRVKELSPDYVKEMASRSQYTSFELIGQIVQVQISNGHWYQGILSKCNPDDFGLQLEMVTRKGMREKAIPSMTIAANDLVQILAQGINAQGVKNKTGFTDGSISGQKENGQRELMRFDDFEGNAVTLDGHMDKNYDQFAANKHMKLNHSTYNENEYTTPLNNKNAQSISRADKMAKQIEGGGRGQQRRSQGGDAEDQFSGVQRRNPGGMRGDGTSYVPPHQRGQQQNKGRPAPKQNQHQNNNNNNNNNNNRNNKGRNQQQQHHQQQQQQQQRRPQHQQQQHQQQQHQQQRKPHQQQQHQPQQPNKVREGTSWANVTKKKEDATSMGGTPSEKVSMQKKKEEFLKDSMKISKNMVRTFEKEGTTPTKEKEDTKKEPKTKEASSKGLNVDAGGWVPSAAAKEYVPSFGGDSAVSAPSFTPAGMAVNGVQPFMPGRPMMPMMPNGMVPGMNPAMMGMMPRGMPNPAMMMPPNGMMPNLMRGMPNPMNNKGMQMMPNMMMPNGQMMNGMMNRNQMQMMNQNMVAMNMGGMNGMMNPNMYMGNGNGDYNKGRGKYKERNGSYHDKKKSHHNHKNKPRSGSKDFNNNHDGGKPALPSNDNK